jgi:hypothetical protein
MPSDSQSPLKTSSFLSKLPAQAKQIAHLEKKLAVAGKSMEKAQGVLQVLLPYMPAAALARCRCCCFCVAGASKQRGVGVQRTKDKQKERQEKQKERTLVPLSASSTRALPHNPRFTIHAALDSCIPPSAAPPPHTHTRPYAGAEDSGAGARRRAQGGLRGERQEEGEAGRTAR